MSYFNAGYGFRNYGNSELWSVSHVKRTSRFDHLQGAPRPAVIRDVVCNVKTEPIQGKLIF